MRPALSIILFTVLAGAGQGLVAVLALATLLGAAPSADFVQHALVVAEVLLAAGLGASFLHLGRKLRAWRAALMWRTSWMSREVIVLPLFMAAVAGWWAAPPAWQPAFAVLSLLLAVALWICTAMIYACLRFIQEWAHPLTTVNYTLLGLSSGLLLAGALAATLGEAVFAARLALPAIVATLAAAGTRLVSLVRNDRLVPRSTLQSATGIRSGKLAQVAMGMTGGSFNTREFFHGQPASVLAMARLGFLVLAFALPLVVLLAAAPSAPAWVAALALQMPGLLAERWYFFAQARHPQNLYYQVVS